MWILFAFLSAFFAGVTSILAKCGIKKTDSNVATAIRTIIVLLFSWIMVFVVGSQSAMTVMEAKTLVFLVLSGLPQAHRGFAISKPCSLVISIKSCRLISQAPF